MLGARANALGKRAAFLQDKQGRIPLPFAVRGSVTRPQIALNKTHLLDLAKKSLVGQVKEKAGKTLKKLLPPSASETDSEKTKNP